MLRLLIEVPLFVATRDGKQTDYRLETGTHIRLLNNFPKWGAVEAEVIVGKYQGLKGNIPASFYATDTMQVV
jgi:hypothetical protein